MPDAVSVPAEVAAQARLALAERARNEGIEGATRRAVVCALELSQSPFVGPETLDLVGAWHAANPAATTPDGRCTRLAGLYGGAVGKRWALEHVALPTTSWLPEESATLEALLPLEHDAELAAVTATRARADRLARLNAVTKRSRQRLREKTYGAAQVAVRDALRRAGVKVVQRASRRSVAAKAAVAAAAGRYTPAVLAAVGMTEQDVLHQVYDTLGDQYETWVQESNEQQLREVAAVLGVAAADVLRQLGPRLTAVAQDSRVRLVDDLTDWSYRLLEDPEPSYGDVGEVPHDSKLPLSVLAGALLLATGRSESETGRPQGDGIIIEAWSSFTADTPPVETVTWVHGDSARAFEPHEALDGVASTWDDYDDVFASDGGFPNGVVAYYPGDHDGCSCSLDSSFEDAGGGDTGGDGGDQAMTEAAA